MNALPAPETAGSQAREPAIAVSGLSKSYGRNKALDAVSFSLQPGIFTALLGPNGAGKSTLFQILTGLFAADGGDVRIAGIDIARHPAAALAEQGIVFQQPSLDLDLTVEQNLAYHAGLHGLTGGRRFAAIEKALAMFDQAGVRKEAARKLSGGNRRKVELARALMTDPSILLLDEATTGLDPAGRRDLVGHVAGLARDRALAILWATHIVSEVVEADRVILLHKGRILADGPPAAIIAMAGTSDLESAFLALTRQPGAVR
ncbi:MAG: ATP-binding cassette domain-containing protein [Alsobacter sp.]